MAEPTYTKRIYPLSPRERRERLGTARWSWSLNRDYAEPGDGLGWCVERGCTLTRLGARFKLWKAQRLEDRQEAFERQQLDEREAELERKRDRDGVPFTGN